MLKLLKKNYKIYILLISLSFTVNNLKSLNIDQDKKKKSVNDFNKSSFQKELPSHSDVVKIHSNQTLNSSHNDSKNSAAISDKGKANKKQKTHSHTDSPKVIPKSIDIDQKKFSTSINDSRDSISPHVNPINHTINQPKDSSSGLYTIDENDEIVIVNWDNKYEEKITSFFNQDIESFKDFSGYPNTHSFFQANAQNILKILKHHDEVIGLISCQECDVLGEKYDEITTLKDLKKIFEKDIDAKKIKYYNISIIIFKEFREKGYVQKALELMNNTKDNPKVFIWIINNKNKESLEFANKIGFNHFKKSNDKEIYYKRFSEDKH